ncbi:MAG: universal stress protein [Blastocatellia bacterium]
MNPVHRILCPTDLSPESDKAIRHALVLAHAFGARVIICHTLEAAPLTDDLETMLHGILDEAARDCLPGGDAMPAYEIMITTGEAVQVITHEAVRQRADLIVMHSRHRSYAATLLGSNAEAVCHNAPCPVLVTHSGEEDKAGAGSPRAWPERILMAHDFSVDSEAALLFGATLARGFQATLHLLHVLPGAQPGIRQTEDTAGQMESAMTQAGELLREAIPARARNGYEIRYAVRPGTPWRVILDYADEHDIDLICLGARGMGFSMEGPSGSNMDQVMRQASCSILVARPPKYASFSMAENRLAD